MSAAFARRPWAIACFGFLLLSSQLRGADAPALISKVEHAPQEPRAGETVTITATLGAPADSVALEYQIVEPGKYIAFADRDYHANWQSLPMEKLHSDTRFSAKIPASAQEHRRLVRYRFKLKDSVGRAHAVPAANNPDANYAYFVYNGVPSWKAAIQPKSRDPKKSKVVEYPPEAVGQVQSYFLIAKRPDVGNAMWHKQDMDKEYRYTGTLVANGRVYDHIRFRARGGEWRYAMGKNMWKFDFHKYNRLHAYDDYGQPYKATWSKVNLRACIQQGDYERRGEQGMFEAVGFRLFNLAGVEAPRTHWIALRVVDGEQENPADQYSGDFWGLYLAIENEDGRFLDEHDLPDGNIFKMKWWQPEVAHQANGQPSDGAKVAAFLAKLRTRHSDPAWWQRNVDLPRYYSYRSILEAIHHYDLDAGKNYTFYFNPKSSKWHVIPWDIDLSWADHMFGGGGEPFKMPVLAHAPFRIEYLNRQREIRDLLFNLDETARLIDECAAIISRRGAPSIVDADRAKWDYHPIMMSRYVNPSKAGHGLFYQSSPTGDFAGMAQQMKDYVKRRSAWIDRTLLTDKTIPQTPTITYTGKDGYPANALSFRASDFAGSGQFAAMKWRIGEIDAKPDFTKKPARPGKYEITPVWESPEITDFKSDISIPADAVKPGHTYRARVRFKDTNGRWSHWSAPVQFEPRNP